jgi:hypothetical protein
VSTMGRGRSPALSSRGRRSREDTPNPYPTMGRPRICIQSPVSAPFLHPMEGRQGRMGSLGRFQLQGMGPGAFISEATVVPVPVRNPLFDILHPKIIPIMGSSGVKHGTPKMKGDKNDHQRERSYCEAFTYSPSKETECARLGQEAACQGNRDKHGPNSPLHSSSWLDLLQPGKRVSELPRSRVIAFFNCIGGRAGRTEHPAGAPGSRRPAGQTWCKPIQD